MKFKDGDEQRRPVTLYNAASLPPAGANTLDACTAVVQEEEEEEVQGEEEGANNILGFCVSSETPRQVKMRK